MSSPHETTQRLNNKPPFVSVVMAVFNAEKYLSQAVESVLNQSLKNIELIIVNDGSNDNSPDILEQFSRIDKRIKLINKPNMGLAVARDTAIQHSCSEYIAIMDADDISLPNRIETQFEFLESNSGISVVGSQWIMIDTDNKEIGFDFQPTQSQTCEKIIFNYECVHDPTVMFRKSAYITVGGYNFDRNMLVPDYDLYMKMHLQGLGFANIPQALFKWRLNPTGITHGKAAAQTQSVIEVRNQGFLLLARSDFEKAKSIAKSIISNFPIGSWQDKKIKNLLPNHEHSLLYKTWLNLPCENREDHLNRSLVLWLNNPKQHSETLREQLIDSNMPWLATPADAYQGNTNPDSARCCDTLELLSEASYLLSIFVEYTGHDADFVQRLQQALALQVKSEFSIEVIIFSVKPTLDITPFLPLISSNNNCVFDDTGFGWDGALRKACGLYFAYLQNDFRLNIDLFLETVSQQISNKTPICFLVEARYFSEVLDENGKPALDNQFQPVWTRGTLLGKNRVQLSNFIHQRSLLCGCNGKLQELGDAAGRYLARYLAITNDFTIINGAVSYFVPGISLSENILPCFQETISDWYLDYGMTCFPSGDFNSVLSKSDIDYFSDALSKAWLANTLFIFPGNITTLERFYLRLACFPIRQPLFRHLLSHNKKTYLLKLWQQKAYVNTLICFLYCSYKLTSACLHAYFKNENITHFP